MIGEHTYDNKGIGGLYDNFRIIPNNNNRHNSFHKPPIVNEKILVSTDVPMETSMRHKRKRTVSAKRTVKRKKQRKQTSLQHVRHTRKRKKNHRKKKGKNKKYRVKDRF